MRVVDGSRIEEPDANRWTRDTELEGQIWNDGHKRIWNGRMQGDLEQTDDLQQPTRAVGSDGLSDSFELIWNKQTVGLLRADWNERLDVTECQKDRSCKTRANRRFLCGKW